MSEETTAGLGWKWRLRRSKVLLTPFLSYNLSNLNSGMERKLLTSSVGSTKEISGTATSSVPESANRPYAIKVNNYPVQSRRKFKS
jgi:hypothetical protein